MAAPATVAESPSARGVRARQRFWAWLRRTAARLERGLDRWRWGLRKRFGRVGPLEILAYRGFGTPERVGITGRVVEAKLVGPSSPADGTWRNLVRMIRRFTSREIPEARVRVRLGPAQVEAETDAEGYFHASVGAAALPASGHGWHAAEIDLLGCPVRGWTPLRSRADVLLPVPQAEM